MSDRSESADVETVGPETPSSVGPDVSVGPLDPEPLDLESLGWRRTYERSAIEKFALDIEAERDRLEAAIDDAERRVDEAQVALAERHAAIERSVAELMAAAREELERLESERDAAVAAIHAEAEREAQRLLDAARRAAASVEEAHRSLRPETQSEILVDTETDTSTGAESSDAG